MPFWDWIAGNSRIIAAAALALSGVLFLLIRGVKKARKRKQEDFEDTVEILADRKFTILEELTSLQP